MLYVLLNTSVHGSIDSYRPVIDKPAEWWKSKSNVAEYKDVRIVRNVDAKGKYSGSDPEELSPDVFEASYVGCLVQDCRTVVLESLNL